MTEGDKENTTYEDFTFLIRTMLKLLKFTIVLSFTLIKFVFAFILIIFTLGAFASRTQKY